MIPALATAAGGGWIMWMVLALLVAVIALYATDRLPMELVSTGIVACLLLLFALPGATGTDGKPLAPETLLAGFGNPALITIMALLVVGQGMFQSGALEGTARRLTASYDQAPRRTLIATFAIVFATSAFINNTPVVVMFLPMMTTLAARTGATPSRLLMPLSFVSMLAGMTTLIGTSTNLLAADALRRTGGITLGFFDLTPMGLVLSGVGIIYIVVAAPKLLPDRGADSEPAGSAGGKHFIAQIEVGEGHSLVGSEAVAGMFGQLPRITVRAVQRGSRSILPPFADIRLQAGDIVIMAATRDALAGLLSGQDSLLREQIAHGGRTRVDSGPLSLSEAVVAPGSRLIARSVGRVGLARRHGLVLLGVQRRSRMIRQRLSEIRLEAGDTLLLCGSEADLDEQRADRDLLLLDRSRTDLPDIRKAGTARLIALAMLAAAISGLVAVLLAALAAAVAMIATGCLNVRQAARGLDLRIFLLVGAALSMGTALEVTGAAGFVAALAVDLASPYGTAAMTSSLFFVSALLTNILSNAATAVILAPIALASAQQVGVDPVPFLFAVIYGANCAFATPIAYQTNLLVMGAGHYRFADYFRFGAPLVMLLWLVFTVVDAWRYNL